MTNAASQPPSLIDLTRMGLADLRELHRRGSAPSPMELRGIADGRILHPRYIDQVRPWRGKVFEKFDGECRGLNRLGLGPVEVHRYRFKARTGPSLFGDRQVLLLDHNQPENPTWVRRFHDELVEVIPGLYLATSHFNMLGRLRFAAYFAISTR